MKIIPKFKVKSSSQGFQNAQVFLNNNINIKKSIFILTIIKDQPQIPVSTFIFYAIKLKMLPDN
jgi:hypothetical protein